MKWIIARTARVLVFALAAALLVGPASSFGFYCADVAMAETFSADAPTRDCCTPNAACATLCQAVPAAVPPAPGEPAWLEARLDPASMIVRPGLDADLTTPPPRVNAV